AANGVMAAAVDVDAGVGVPAGHQAGDVGADVVALDNVAASTGPLQEDAVPVAGDDVAGAGGRAADGHAGGPRRQGNAVGELVLVAAEPGYVVLAAEDGAAVSAQADDVALDDRAGRPGTGDEDPVRALPEMTLPGPVPGVPVRPPMIVFGAPSTSTPVALA